MLRTLALLSCAFLPAFYGIFSSTLSLTSASSTTLSTSITTTLSTSLSTTTSAPLVTYNSNSSSMNSAPDISKTAPTSSGTSSTQSSSTQNDNTSISLYSSSTEGTTITSRSETSIDMTSSTTTGQASPSLGVIILPAVIVPLLCVIIVAILVFLYFRYVKQNSHGFSEKKVTSKPIDILEFENVLKDMNANSQLKFSEEFSSLASVGNEYSKDVAGQEGNRDKNRYSDIKPYDISRVKLSINPEDESDYINASWIPGYFSRRQYIAAQGPMPSTQDDFWRMVWEYNSRIIIMLTKITENNRMKCCQYWPSGRETVMYGDIAVNIIDETESDSWVIREMNVAMGQQKRLVKQCFFSKWPDMKTPEESSSIIEFIKMVRSFCPIRGSSPLIVHCSAGVGRTGAFIAIDTALYQIDEEKNVDIFGIVYKMRLNRISMVQNERQYIFVYETVGEIIRNHLEERDKRKPSNGQTEFFFGSLPKSDSVPDTLPFPNYDNGALAANDDNKALL